MAEHLNLVKENIALTRHGKRKNSLRDRIVDVTSHGKKIKENFNEISTEFKSKKRVQEKFILKIEKESPITLNLESIGLRLLAELDNKETLVAEVIDETLFNNCISDFTANKINKSRAVHYTEFANINEFRFMTPEEKMSPRLIKELTKNNSSDIVIDIQLHTSEFSNLKRIYENTVKFNNYINQYEAEIVADLIMEHLVIIRIKICRERVYTFLEHNNIFTADLLPKPLYEEINYKSISFDNLPEIINPDENAPRITFVDSGVLPSHPLLSGSVEASESFGNFSTPFDEEGHGTMVAGIIQYGNLYKEIIESQKTNKLKQNFRLLSARVTDNNNFFPKETIISKTVYEAIDYFANPENDYQSSIFNVSLGDKDSPYIQGSKMDPWSYQLDILNHKYNIAIVVSSGNYEPESDARQFIKNYSHYMLEDQSACIIPPAISISSITVGSIAIDSVPDSHGSRKTINLPIAEHEEPSPFTRLGPGYKESIKPDTIAHGGNYALDGDIKKFITNDRNLGVLSTSLFNKSNNSWFEVRNGTSFAAPYITHLLGKIKSQFPSAKGNLLRALLLSNTYENSSTRKLIVDNTAKELKDSELDSLIQRFNGYGKIREDSLTNSSERCVKMYYEGELEIEKVSIFEIPIPSEIYNSKKSAYVTITIAYNPPCRDSRIDYKGVSLDFVLLRGIDKQTAISYLCKPERKEFDQIKDIEAKFKCKMSPSGTRASKGTTIVSKHKVTNSRETAEEEYSNQFYLGIRSFRKWYSGEKPQPFAVVVTIETEDEEINIYAPIKNRVQTRTQQRARV